MFPVFNVMIVKVISCYDNSRPIYLNCFYQNKMPRWNCFASVIASSQWGQSSSDICAVMSNVIKAKVKKSWKFWSNPSKMVGEIIDSGWKTLLLSYPSLVVIVKKPIDESITSQPGARWTNWNGQKDKADVVGEPIQLRASQLGGAQTLFSWLFARSTLNPDQRAGSC